MKQLPRSHTVSVKAKVLEVLSGNPALSYSIIARNVGVTRERVRQIARQNGYPPRTGILKLKRCPVCGKVSNIRNLYCSTACSYKAIRKRVVVDCYQCGKSIERTPSNMRTKSGKNFCSRACYGKSKVKYHSIGTKNRKTLTGDFTYKIGSKYEYPLIIELP